MSHLQVISTNVLVSESESARVQTVAALNHNNTPIRIVFSQNIHNYQLIASEESGNESD